MPQTKLDLTGQKYGLLTVIRHSHYDKKSYWICQCDCGTQVTVAQANLRSGNTQSCGCVRRQPQPKKEYGTRDTGHKTHGLSRDESGSRTPTYMSWSGMKTRCYNPKTPTYKQCGGRGIKVCDEWKESFEQFLADMGPRPPGTMLVRIREAEDFKPGNCRWEIMRTRTR
jgi:hypothetical protein